MSEKKSIISRKELVWIAVYYSASGVLLGTWWSRSAGEGWIFAVAACTMTFFLLGFLAFGGVAAQFAKIERRDRR